MARTDRQINLRIPAELKDALDAQAERNKRSLTAEVVARLEASLEPQPASWAKTFPFAAAAAKGFSPLGADELQAAQAEGQAMQERLRVMELRSQVMSLDAQALGTHSELMKVQRDLDFAEDGSDRRAVEALRHRRAMLERHLREIDALAQKVRATLSEVEGRPK